MTTQANNPGFRATALCNCYIYPVGALNAAIEFVALSCLAARQLLQF
jgi:hypothetical protein